MVVQDFIERCYFWIFCYFDYCLRKIGCCCFGFLFREMKEICILSNVDLQLNIIKGKFFEIECIIDDCYINVFNLVILNYW